METPDETTRAIVFDGFCHVCSGWAGFMIRHPTRPPFQLIPMQSDEGRALLERNGVGPQKNFELLVHPNASRKAEDKMTTFMGQPVSWIPTTWVFRDGKLLYAFNYGELHFPMLQQLIRDSSDKWEH